jgi:hypothetical protein
MNPKPRVRALTVFCHLSRFADGALAEAVA